LLLQRLKEDRERGESEREEERGKKKKERKKETKERDFTFDLLTKREEKGDQVSSIDGRR